MFIVLIIISDFRMSLKADETGRILTRPKKHEHESQGTIGIQVTAAISKTRTLARVSTGCFFNSGHYFLLKKIFVFNQIWEIYSLKHPLQ